MEPIKGLLDEYCEPSCPSGYWFAPPFVTTEERIGLLRVSPPRYGEFVVDGNGVYPSLRGAEDAAGGVSARHGRSRPA